MNLGQLIELALGPEQARKVDTAIPQAVFDQMTQAARENIAGWYYAPEAGLMGRLLTKDECWQEIKNKLHNGKLWAFIAGVEIGYAAQQWPCLRYHVERDEIQLASPKSGVELSNRA
jgi:hypothetical protein